MMLTTIDMVWRCGCCDTWHQVLLTSDRLGTKHPVSVNIISSSFTSSRETPLTAAKPINTSASKPQVTNIWEIFLRQRRTILTRSIWNRNLQPNLLLYLFCWWNSFPKWIFLIGLKSSKDDKWWSILLAPPSRQTNNIIISWVSPRKM